MRTLGIDRRPKDKVKLDSLYKQLRTNALKLNKANELHRKLTDEITELEIKMGILK